MNHIDRSSPSSFEKTPPGELPKEPVKWGIHDVTHEKKSDLKGEDLEIQRLISQLVTKEISPSSQLTSKEIISYDKIPSSLRELAKLLIDHKNQKHPEIDQKQASTDFKRPGESISSLLDNQFSILLRPPIRANFYEKIKNLENDQKKIDKQAKEKNKNLDKIKSEITASKKPTFEPYEKDLVYLENDLKKTDDNLAEILEQIESLEKEEAPDPRYENTLNRIKDQLEKQKASLKKRLDELKDKFSDQLKKEETEWNNEIKRLNETKVSLENELTQLEKEKTELTKEASKFEKIQATLEKDPFSISDPQRKVYYLDEYQSCFSQYIDEPNLNEDEKKIIADLLALVKQCRLVFIPEAINTFEGATELETKYFTPEETTFFKELLKKKDFKYDVYDLSLPLLSLSPEEKKSFRSIKENLSKTIQEWLSTIEERGVNKSHRDTYGEDWQSLYIQHSKLLSIFSLTEFEKPTLTNIELMKKIGEGRRLFAKLSRTEGAASFGIDRGQGTAVIQLNRPAYEAYNERAKELCKDGKSFKLSLKEKGLEVKYEQQHSYWGGVDDAVVTNTRSCKTWDKLSELLSNAKEKPLSLDELGRRIARFHYYFALFMPFHRGSAAVAEDITDALWLHHGYIPPQVDTLKDMDNKVSLDLEAMVPKSGPDIDKDGLYPEDRYVRDYLSFMKVQPKPITELEQESNLSSKKKT